MYEGLPFRGTPMPIGESEASKPVLGYESKAEVLDTGKPTDLDRLGELFTKARKKFLTIEFIEKEYSPETGHWRVFITWTDKFYTNGVPHVDH
jgi:hypothetical protein